jgi:hypothetical protein
MYPVPTVENVTTEPAATAFVADSFTVPTACVVPPVKVSVQVCVAEPVAVMPLV